MSKPIEVRYVWNSEHIEKLFDASYKYQFEHSRKRYIGWFFIALMQYGIVVALKKEAFAILLFTTIVLLYWYYGKKWIAKRRAKKAFEQSEFKNKEIELTVDNDGFHLISPNREEWRWEELEEVVSLGDDIMIYKYPNFHYLPANGFKSMEEKSRFKTLAKEKGKLKC